jgi:hypothetical protein
MPVIKQYPVRIQTNLRQEVGDLIKSKARDLGVSDSTVARDLIDYALRQMDEESSNQVIETTK